MIGSDKKDLRRRFVMERIFYALAFWGCSTALSVAQNCEVATAIPQNQTRVASGSATVHYDGTSKLKGGQAVYVKIKNENVLGVSYLLNVSQDTSPEVSICTYKAVLLPKTSVILWGAVFANPPISWKVTVTVGEESDAGALTYEVYSNPKPQSTRKHNLKLK